MNKGDKCMFTEEAYQQVGGDALKAALIRIFIDHNITHKRFAELHKEYMLAIGTHPKLIASSRNNLLKVILYKDTLTYSRLEMILKNILGLNLVNLTMTLKDEKNESHVVSIDRITY